MPALRLSIEGSQIGPRETSPKTIRWELANKIPDNGPPESPTN